MNRAAFPALLAAASLALLAAGGCATGPKITPQAQAQAAAMFAEGKGMLLKVERELGLDRPDAKVGVGALSSQQFADLTTARMELRDAAFTDPAATWAPEAMLLAARALDYGRLQQFYRAIDEYLDVAARFPQSPEGKEAAGRALVLEQKISSTPGMAEPR